MSFKVLKAGFLATVQDYGRLGRGAQGMSRCGAMDEHAYCWGNHLLDNHFNAAAIEITFGAFELEATQSCVVAVTGADLEFRINGTRAPLWHSLQISPGDRLSWGMPKSGIRAYLCVSGGFNTKTLFDSKSVNLREHIGNKIEDGEILKCDESSVAADRFISKAYLPNYGNEVILHLLPSYQFGEFSINQRDLFFNQAYQISNASDRSGCRLSGAPISLRRERMISEGMSYGSVEIANDGLPIILLKDAPTIGGYPKIGTVLSLDLSLLAQQQPGAKVRFTPITIDQAQTERLKFNRFFDIVER